MALYLVTRTDTYDYDEYDALVVRAKDAEEARSIALTDYDQGSLFSAKYQGFTPENTKVDAIPAGGESGVVCSSYNAG